MSTKICTGKVRLSYAHLFEPVVPTSGGDPKYSVSLLIPKSDTKTLELIKGAMAEARENFCKKNGVNALPPKPQNTLHDGDALKSSGEAYGPECKGCWVISVSSKKQPMIVDLARTPILDPNEVYSGCYAQAVIDFYGYSRSGNKGITAELKGIRKIADGEPFGNVCTADDFADFDGMPDETDGWM